MKIRTSSAGLRKRVALAFRDIHATRAELGELRQEVARQGDVLRELVALRAAAPSPLAGDGYGHVERRLDVLSEQSTLMLGEQRRTIDALQLVYDQEPDNRRRLHALRQTEEYELAYTEPEPLVSVVIPTYRSFETLRDRAIPSVLAQTYPNWEIVVIGDAAPPETAEVIAGFGDARIRYENKSMRGPYPEDEYDAWLVTAVPPFNAGMRAAKGRWIAPFADDDSLRPDALRHLLEAAKEHRHEHCYGKLFMHGRDGRDEMIGAYPPRLSPTGIEGGGQGSLLHAGLRFFEQELADAIFRTPSDWSMLRRMLRAGVRIGFIDEVTCDYFPSYRGEDAPTGKPFR